MNLYLYLSVSLLLPLTNLQTINGEGMLESALQENWCLHPNPTVVSLGINYELTPCNYQDGTQQLNANDFLNYKSTPGQMKFDIYHFCVDISSNNLNSSLSQQQCNSAHTSQQWKLVNGSISGAFQLQNSQSLLCLGSAPDAPYATHQYTCDVNNIYLYWVIKYLPQFGDGLAVNSGTTDCLSLSTLSTADGTDIDFQPCNFYGSPGQIWNVLDWTAATSSTLMKNAYNSYSSCAKVSNSSGGSGVPIQQFQCDASSPSQLWYIIGSIFSNFKMYNVETTMCLMSNATSTVQEVCTNEEPYNSNQLFKRALQAWPLQTLNTDCTSGFQCLSGSCQDNAVCSPSGINQPCRQAYDCNSNFCSNGLCGTNSDY